VRYVLEGSVRKAGGRIRITGQLIDASSGGHLWAERFEGGLDDIFDLQDRVTARVVGAIAPKVEQAEIQRAQRKPTESLDAYDYFLRGRECLVDGREADGVPYFQRAAELDPSYSHAHAGHAVSLIGRYWSDQSPETFQQALTAAKKAISIDSNDAWCQHAMGFVLLFGRQHSLAGIHYERAQELNPVDSMILGDRASWFRFGGRPEEALQVLDAAMMRDPFPPIWFWRVRGSALFDLQRYEEAISAFQHVPEGFYLAHAQLAAAYAMVGDLDNARHQTELALVVKSDLSVKKVGFYLVYTDQAARDRYLDAMRTAGLPD
jgi:tetratricopeptide (TPR) repeat protein